MARKDIRVPLDRQNRNNHNDNYTQLFEGVQQVKKTIDDLVLESGGDSNLEVVQARGGESTLNSRLDRLDDKDNELTSQLAETVKREELERGLRSKADRYKTEREISTKADLEYVNRQDTSINKRIDNLLIESGDANAEVNDSKQDFLGNSHDLLRQRLNADLGLSLGLNKGNIKTTYKNGRLVTVEETNGNEIIRSVELIYKNNKLDSVVEQIGTHIVSIKINQKNGILQSVEKEVL